MDEASDHLGLRPNRACRACVQLKAKCIPRAGAGLSTCERCYRLGKTCATPAPRKRGRQQASEVSHLHDKIESLTRALQLRQNSAQSASESLASASTPGHSPSIPKNFDERLQEHEYFPRGNVHLGSSVFDISPEIGHIFVAPFHEQHFETFRTRMGHHFPFVVFPDDMPPSTVMKEQPFLFTVCVMTALHSDQGLRARIARDILAYISEHMIVRGEKSLDLIQGLLVMCAWYGSFSHSNPQLMNLLHLTKALLIDLGLTRPAGGGGYAVKMSAEGVEQVHGNVPRPMHSLDERRAILGYYFATAKFASAFRRLDAMLWTKHLEQCCDVVQRSEQHLHDHRAISLVQLKHLVEKYSELEAGIRPGQGLPLQAYIALITTDVGNFRRNLRPELRADTFIKLEIIQTELVLLEPALDADAESPAQKVDVLHFCLTKAIEYFDTFTSIKVEDIPHLPFLSWMNCANAFDILGKLCFLNVEGWDLDYARNSPGFLNTILRMQTFLEDVYKHERRQPGNRSVRFKVLASRTGQATQWYHNKIKQELEQEAADRAASNGQLDMTLNGEDPTSGQDFCDFLWQDVMKDWPSFNTDLAWNTP